MVVVMVTRVAHGVTDNVLIRVIVMVTCGGVVMVLIMVT